jgi:CRISPR/Cas system CMR subunit Cmr4 (Cas7 group RAMP superfamily)
LHIVLPESRLELIRRSEKTKFHVDHLEIKEIRGIDRLVLVLEDLFEDYERACKEMIARIKEGRLSGWKFEGD